ncbi:uncharacterized protein BP5553_04223 [Venustampulla echinocandica]|uniref:Uncharacterized protein n=1 Tax=Venustampulla echinocandica TaxID=2656787 RepID=A0A370TWH5_9HELO|nr:uncharacterized protein BP5553_04223 [Venustampulla echinocandica]RDL39883.1 hypothetical protein BP5553_04223 [Venustampulla echinocandica]
MPSPREYLGTLASNTRSEEEEVLEWLFHDAEPVAHYDLNSATSWPRRASPLQHTTGAPISTASAPAPPGSLSSEATVINMSNSDSELDASNNEYSHNTLHHTTQLPEAFGSESETIQQENYLPSIALLPPRIDSTPLEIGVDENLDEHDTPDPQMATKTENVPDIDLESNNSQSTLSESYSTLGPMQESPVPNAAKPGQEIAEGIEPLSSVNPPPIPSSSLNFQSRHGGSMSDKCDFQAAAPVWKPAGQSPMIDEEAQFMEQYPNLEFRDPVPPPEPHGDGGTNQSGGSFPSCSSSRSEDSAEEGPVPQALKVYISHEAHKIALQVADGVAHKAADTFKAIVFQWAADTAEELAQGVVAGAERAAGISSPHRPMVGSQTESAAPSPEGPSVYFTPEPGSILPSIKVHPPVTKSRPYSDNVQAPGPEKLLAHVVNSFIREKDKVVADAVRSHINLQLQKLSNAALVMKAALRTSRALVPVAASGTIPMNIDEQVPGYTTGGSLQLTQKMHNAIDARAVTMMNSHDIYLAGVATSHGDVSIAHSSRCELDYFLESIREHTRLFDPESNAQQIILGAASNPPIEMPRRAENQEMPAPNFGDSLGSPDIFIAHVPTLDFTVIGDNLTRTKETIPPTGKRSSQTNRAVARVNSRHRRRPAHPARYTHNQKPNTTSLARSLILCYLFLLAMPEEVPMNIFFQASSEADNIGASSLDDSPIMRALTETAFSNRYWALDFTSLHCYECIDQIMRERKRAFLKRWAMKIKNTVANLNHCAACRCEHSHLYCDHSSEFHQWLHSSGNKVGRLQYIRLTSRSYSSINPESLASAINILKKHAHNLLGAQVDLYIPGTPELQITDKGQIGKLVHCFGELEKLLPAEGRLQVLGLEFHPKLGKRWGSARRPWWVGTGGRG